MLAALRVVRSLTDGPVIANLSPVAIGVTRDGIPLGEALSRLAAAGADVVGLNCNLGPSGILRSYEGIRLDPSILYGAVPNAGLLHLVDGDYSYTGSADYFADVACALHRLGVRFIGGCCGTTPEHIRRADQRLAFVSAEADGEAGLACAADDEDLRPVRLRATAGPEVTVVAADGSHPAARATGVSDAAPETPPPARAGSGQTLVDLVRQRVTVMVELDPPKTLDCSRYLQGAAALRNAGADFITLADNSLAMARVSNLALASLLKQMGIEPLVHVTCRDRNLTGQQSHLMGLHVLGIPHILLVTGDPSR
ncbi:MAG: homocysteine S-methyltransferase family protein, partial [Alicyclobacillaceae bacterium]|nr:homocysteine S-methyltransferase family protein [Alicyclobacillaceae bacterium]